MGAPLATLLGGGRFLGQESCLRRNDGNWRLHLALYRHRRLDVVDD